MAREIILAAVIGCGLASPVASTAQTAHLLEPGALCASECVGQLLTVDTDGPTVLAATAVPAAQGPQGAFVTPDGRFVVWFEPANPSVGRPPRVALHDVATRATSVLTAPAEARGIVGNPVTPEIYLADGGGPIAWSFAGVRRLGGPGCTESWPHGVSGDGRRVVYTCTHTGAASELLVIEVGSGAVVGRLPEAFSPALDADGDALYAVAFTSGPRLRRYDVASGALLNDVEAPPGTSSFGVHVDPRRNRVIVTSQRVDVFDGTTMQPLATIPLFGPTSTTHVASATLDAAGARLYVTGREFVGGFQFHSYIVFDAASLTPLLHVPPGSAPVGQLIGAARPLPPAALAASVQGASVQLTWNGAAAPPATTRYVLEVGSAAGLNDIIAGLDAGRQTAFAASGVPPGTYHVRVRAANYAGASAPSNEVVVTVPGPAASSRPPIPETAARSSGPGSAATDRAWPRRR